MNNVVFANMEILKNRDIEIDIENIEILNL